VQSKVKAKAKAKYTFRWDGGLLKEYLGVLTRQAFPGVCGHGQFCNTGLCVINFQTGLCIINFSHMSDVKVPGLEWLGQGCHYLWAAGAAGQQDLVICHKSFY
jgi:hypothetical protein